MRPQSILLAAAFVGCTFPYEVGKGTEGGSCGDLPAGAVVACGTCGSIPCVNGTFGACVEPENKPGTKCGTCGKATYTCSSPGVVECTSPDDRTAGSDFAFTTSTDIENRAVNRRAQLAVSYTVKHDGEIGSVRFMLRRTTYACGSTTTLPHPDPACGMCTTVSTGGYTCIVDKPVTPGTVRLQIFRGTPDMKLETVPPLASVEVDPSELPDTTMASTYYEFTFKTPIAVKTGDPITFVLGTDSTSTGLIAGLARDKILDPTSAPEHKTWTRNVYPSTAWITQPRSYAFIDVKMRGCF